MQRMAGRRILRTQAVVEIMVNVNMAQRNHQNSHVVHVPLYVNTCAHGWVHNPHDVPTGELMAREGDEKGREIYRAGALAQLRAMVKAIS